MGDDLAELVLDLGLGPAFALDALAFAGRVEAEADCAGVAVSFRVDGRLVLPDDDLHRLSSFLCAVGVGGCVSVAASVLLWVVLVALDVLIDGLPDHVGQVTVLSLGDAFQLGAPTCVQAQAVVLRYGHGSHPARGRRASVHYALRRNAVQCTYLTGVSREATNSARCRSVIRRSLPILMLRSWPVRSR